MTRIADQTIAASEGHAATTAQWPRLLTAFIVSMFLLEGNYGDTPLNFGNLIISAASAFVVITILSSAILRSSTVTGLMPHDKVFFGYAAFLLATAAYPHNPNALQTFVGAIYHIIIWLGALFLAGVGHLKIIRTFILTATIVALISFATVLIDPNYAFQPISQQGYLELRGIMSHQLRLGLAMSIATGVFFVAILNRELVKILPKHALFVVIILILCAYFAWARLYSVQMVLALMITIFLGSRGLTYYFFGFLIFLLFCLGLIYWEPIFLFMDESDFDNTLSGRTLAWERTLEIGQDHPWLGFGYATFDNAIFDFAFGRWRPAHPHNSYLHAYFETGYLGLILVVVLIFLHHRVGRRFAQVTGKYSYSTFVVWLAILGSFTGSNYAGKPTLLITFVLLIVGAEARQTRLEIQRN